MFIKFSGFDWDKGNRDKSLRKHGIGIAEAEEACLGKNFVYPDERHSTATEKRFVLFGASKQGRQLFISLTVRENKIRVINARPMSQKERNWYEAEKKKTFH